MSFGETGFGSIKRYDKLFECKPYVINLDIVLN